MLLCCQAQDSGYKISKNFNLCLRSWILLLITNNVGCFAWSNRIDSFSRKWLPDTHVWVSCLSVFYEKAATWVWNGYARVPWNMKEPSHYTNVLCILAIYAYGISKDMYFKVKTHWKGIRDPKRSVVTFW